MAQASYGTDHIRAKNKVDTEGRLFKLAHTLGSVYRDATPSLGNSYHATE